MLIHIAFLLTLAHQFETRVYRRVYSFNGFIKADLVSICLTIRAICNKLKEDLGSNQQSSLMMNTFICYLSMTNLIIMRRISQLL